MNPVAGCDDTPASSEAPPTEKGSWAIHTPFDWSHDGAPFQSVYCTMYSDAASHQLKQRLGQLADEAFDRVMQLFHCTDTSDFIYPPGYSKIEIYINMNHTESVNWAYWGGFIFTIRTDDISGWAYDYTVYTLTHELVHILEFLIEGRAGLSSDVWFREGIATYSGCLYSPAYQRIETLGELESWITQNQNTPGQGNPVAIHSHSDLPEGANRHEYFRMSELAVRYLVDQNGMGKTCQDVSGLFYDLRNGISFSSSFESRFGMSLHDYEEEFFDRMRAYLSIGAAYQERMSVMGMLTMSFPSAEGFMGADCDLP